MEEKQSSQQTVARLALCVILAVGLYAALDKLGGGIPQLAPYRPWLERNKVQAIAITAAVLFGLSLAVSPLDRAHEASPDQSPDPCDGYERADGLP